METAWELGKSLHPVSRPAAQPSPALCPARRMTCRKHQVNRVHVTILFISVLRLSDASSTESSAAHRAAYHLPATPARTAVLTKQPRFQTRSVLSHCLLWHLIFFGFPMTQR